MRPTPDADDVRRDLVDALFGAVFSLPPAGRTAAIDRACGDNRGLRGAVIALLAAHDQPLGVLQRVERGLELRRGSGARGC